MNAYKEREQKASSEKDKTGIPAQMKSKFERSSGFSFDDVRVHYNSEKPAQLHAHAYTQGSEVFVAPGQEKHLPHELGHVVQQKSNAVKPTGEIGGMPLNDDKAMERGADKLAEKAESAGYSGEAPVQAKAKEGGVVQREASPESASWANWAALGNSGVNLGNMIFNFMGLYSNLKLKREEDKNNREDKAAERKANKEEKDIDSIEKYVDLACEAYEEFKIAKSEFDNITGTSDEEKKKKNEKEAQMKKSAMKIKRFFEAALSKASSAGLAAEDATIDDPKLDVADRKVKFTLKRANDAYTESKTFLP